MNTIQKSLIICLMLVPLVGGCTLQSTKIAQNGSLRSQAVLDGVHRDMFVALSRENYETAKLTMLLEIEKLKEGKSDEEKSILDATASILQSGLTEFAKKRDFQVEWDRDHSNAQSLKMISVDSKLFSMQGILNYIFGALSDGAKASLNAWDEANKNQE